MAKDQFKIKDSALFPYSILKEKHGGFIIEETVTRVNKTTGEKTEGVKTVLYPSTIESAIKWIVEAKLADSDKTLTLKDFLKDYKSIKQELINALEC